MRVLVVDQDSASNLAITRSLRDLYTVDCVTNKGDCLDLLRSNTFEVIVATERLEDGSGLELLGTISKKWPSVLRIFAADRQRLQLLRGRLGPFNIFQTLSYPIDPEKLTAALESAAAAGQQSDETEEPPAEETVEETPESHDALDIEQSDEFSEPRFARAGRAAPMQVTSIGGRSSTRPAPAVQPRSSAGQSRSGAGPGRSGMSQPRSAGGQSRSGAGQSSLGAGQSRSGTGQSSVGAGQSRSSAPSAHLRSARSISEAGPDATGGARSSRSRRVDLNNESNDLAAKFPGSGTIGPRRSAGPSRTGAGRSTSPSGGGLRSASAGAPSFADGSPDSGGSGVGGPVGRRARTAGAKAPPVRFPPLERNPPLERTPPLERFPPLEPPSAPGGGDFSEAAAMARAARSNYEATSDEFDTKRVATMIGGGVAVAAVVVFLAFKMFGSKSEAPKPPAAVVAHAPDYPREVTDLVAKIEADFKADDFKAARAAVDELRQLSPSHPRLGFFDGLLISRGDAVGKNAAAKGAKKNGARSGASSAAAKAGAGSAASTGPTGSVAKSGVPGSHDAESGSAAASASADSSHLPGSPFRDAATTASMEASTGATTTSSPTLPPEIPPGLTRASSTSSEGVHPPTSSASSSVSSSAAGPGGAATTPDSLPASTSATPATAPTSAASGPGAPTSSAGANAATSASVTAPAGADADAAASGSAAAATSASASASTTAPGSAELTHASAAPARHRSAGEPPPVVQEAKLIRRVNPDYPSAAKKEGIVGSVDLEVTVSPQGTVQDASVIHSTPPGMFEKSAVEAVRKWKYDPRFVDGLASQAHVKVHLEFGPNR